MTIEDYKREFLNIFSNIKREGVNKLADYLSSSDFFDAPASTKHHSAYCGGLMVHSVLVYRRLLQLIKTEYGEDFTKVISLESIAICALLHDVCKIDFYKLDFRNAKINGVWEQVPYFSIDDKLPYGHGEKSVYIVSGFMRLTRDEAMAINWHMGGFDARMSGGYNSALSDAFAKYPVAVLCHIADMQATHLDESKISF